MKETIKKIFGKSYVRNYLYLVTCLFLTEIIFKLISGSSIFTISTLRIFIILNFVSIIISFFLNYAGHKLTKVIMSLLVFASSAYACFQCGFYDYFNMYGSIQSSGQLGAVKDYIKDFIASFKWQYFMVFIPFIALLTVLIFFDKQKKNKINLKHNATLSGSILVTTAVLIYASISIGVFQNKYQAVSNLSLFKNASNSSLTIENYGCLGFLTLDVKSALFPVETPAEYEYEIVNKETEKTVVNEKTRVIDDTVWKKVIESEKDEDYKTIGKYLINREISDKNDYTGMFEGKNLIVIMMESVNDVFLNPEYYPNFNKLVSEGWYWENNYSPRNNCPTFNNEFSGLTSLVSINNMCTAKVYPKNTYYESMFNLFNRTDNYVTFSAHDYTDAYYPRSKVHPTMGSREYYGVKKLGIKYSNEYKDWANDDDFLKEVLNIIDKKTSNGENFMTWLTTVSSHQPYSYSSVQGDKYYNMTKNTKLPTDLRRYMSKLKILDDGLGILLNGLEERGILDDTVIVLYGDHYPYGIKTNTLNKVLDYDTSEYNNADRVPFVIYNSQIESKVFSEYTTYLNVLPTLANLFNLDYDPRLYLGTDLLSENPNSYVIFSDGNWKNEKAFYDASKNKIKYFSSDEYTPEEIMSINNDINARINISNKIITTNYFEHLEKALAKKEKELLDGEKNICLIDDIVIDDSNTEQISERTTTTTTTKRRTTKKQTTKATTTTSSTTTTTTVTKTTNTVATSAVKEITE